MCYTINDHWGIGNMDFNYKSPAELIRALCDCRKVGANLLLNIGPTAQGGIDPFQKELFNMIGRWVEIFGESIYEVKPYPAYSMGSNFALKANDGSALYLFFTDLNRGGSAHVVAGSTKYAGAYSFGDVTDEIESIHWIDNGEELNFTQGSGMLSLDAKGYDYGLSTCVRVAKAIIKK